MFKYKSKSKETLIRRIRELEETIILLEKINQKEELIFSRKDAGYRPSWIYIDTLSLPEGIYVYRIELLIKGKLIADESVIVNRFTPGFFPSVTRFEANGNSGNKLVTLKWETKNSGRIRNLQLERKNSLEKDFSLIAALPSTDSVYIDSVIIPNEAYFYRFQTQD